MPTGAVKCERCGIAIITKTHNRRWCDKCRRPARQDQRALVRHERQRHRWTATEIEYLRDNYHQHAWKDLVENLALEKSKIQAKASSLGLSRKSSRPRHGHGSASSVRLINHLLKLRGCRGCQVCGEHRWLDIHHMDGNRGNNEYENLIVLCPNHHAAMERPPWEWRKCKRCGEDFVISRGYRLRNKYDFCSIECRRRKIAKTCQQCGSVFHVGAHSESGKNRQFCSKSCQGRAVARRRLACQEK
jgi:hypothetical protein